MPPGKTLVRALSRKGAHAASRDVFEALDGVRAFRKGLDALDRASHGAGLFARRGQKCPPEMLHTIAFHNSYHLGQAVLLRQMLGAWPPPSGGLTG